MRQLAAHPRAARFEAGRRLVGRDMALTCVVCRGEDFDETDGGKLAKRLIIAFVLIAAIALVNILVLRRFDMDLHPMVLFGAFGVILAASVISAFESRPRKVQDEANDMGCAVGCCQGPRPIGELSRKAAQKRNQTRLPTRQPKQ